MKKYIHRLRRWMCFLRQTAHILTAKLSIGSGIGLVVFGIQKSAEPLVQRILF